MGVRSNWFITPSLRLSWWLLKCEIVFLHARFREARQEGDMMVDIENVFQSLDEYLTGVQTAIGAAADLAEPMVEEAHGPQAQPLGPDDDLGEIAYQHARNLNGVEVDRSEREGEIDEAGRRNIALTRKYYEGQGDGDINMEEDPMER